MCSSDLFPSHDKEEEEEEEEEEDEKPRKGMKGKKGKKAPATRKGKKASAKKGKEKKPGKKGKETKAKKEAAYPILTEYDGEYVSLTIKASDEYGTVKWKRKEHDLGFTLTHPETEEAFNLFSFGSKKKANVCLTYHDEDGKVSVLLNKSMSPAEAQEAVTRAVAKQMELPRPPKS